MSVAAWSLVAWRRGWAAGEPLGLALGIAAASLMLLAALYPLRRRLTGRVLRTAQDWLQVHVYGATLAALFVLLHIGFAWPSGPVGWSLVGLTAWTTASGVIGVVVQKVLPEVLAKGLTVEVVYDRIPDLVARLQAEARDCVDGASDVLRRFYESQVAPALAGVTPSWSYVLNVHAGRDRALAAFDSIQTVVSDEDRQRLDDLRALLTEKIELEAHYTLQLFLRGWLWLHVPPAMLLLAAVAAHVAAVWYY